MIRKRYSDEFNEFWQMFKIIEDAGLGTRGNKNKAEIRYKQKKIEPSDFEFIRQSLEKQVEAKLARRAAGLFDPDFMQVEGWINNERWDDEISGPTDGLCESDRRKASAVRNYIQSDMGQSVARADSTKTH